MILDRVPILLRWTGGKERLGERSRQIVQVADLEISFVERTVRKNGCEIALKPMEFELLCVLVKNKNIAISRENLLKMVWGVDYIGESRTVAVRC